MSRSFQDVELAVYLFVQHAFCTLARFVHGSNIYAQNLNVQEDEGRMRSLISRYVTIHQSRAHD